MSDSLHFSVEGPSSKIHDLMRNAALSQKGDYENGYFHVEDDILSVIASSGGDSSASFSTVTEEYLDITCHGEWYEAIFNVETFSLYLDHVGCRSDDSLSLNFFGEEGENRSTVVEMEGGLSARAFLIDSESVREKLPLWIPNEFDDDGGYNPNDEPLQTTIETSVSEISKIISIVDTDEIDVSDRYPIVTENCEMVLQVEDRLSRNSIWGNLDADKIEGPDVSNGYNVGFRSVFETLTGDVRLMLSPGGSPLVIVKDDIEGVTYRHIIGSHGTV